jgi:hypothetical protein
MPYNRSYRALTYDIRERLKQNYRLAKALPDFLREPITPALAEERIRGLLADRKERFLQIAKTRIYSCPSSPYLKLLRIAACEFSDLEDHVRRNGLEDTLALLARAGVYLTVAEYKGRTEVRRGSDVFRVSPDDFAHPDPPPGFVAQTSGTNTIPVSAVVALERIAVQALEVAVFFSAHGLWQNAHAMYDAILPAGAGVRALLINAKLGVATERWFARKVPTKSLAGAWYSYLTTHWIVALGKFHGAGFASPRFTEIADVGRIVRWISKNRAARRATTIKTATTNAARIAERAETMGVSLEGTTFVCGGEPLTDGKRDAILRSGASATPHYGFVAGGSVGNGCGRPAHTDEVHVNRQTFALIAGPERSHDAGDSVRPFLFTTLLPSDPWLLFNVENGDYGILDERNCDCALERAGLTLHLHHIRSYEKFTSEGMNYYYGDIFEIFDKLLPEEFGGGPGDYQLVEEEDGAGRTRLTLRVHPKIANLNEEKIIARLSEHLASGSWEKQFQVRVWREAGTLRVRREAPHASERGKILPLHAKAGRSASKP